MTTGTDPITCYRFPTISPKRRSSSSRAADKKPLQHSAAGEVLEEAVDGAHAADFDLLDAFLQASLTVSVGLGEG